MVKQLVETVDYQLYYTLSSIYCSKKMRYYEENQKSLNTVIKVYVYGF
jgi:hypothetical protein